MRHISNDKKKEKKCLSSCILIRTGQRSTRPVEETTGATSISVEGAFFATSDVSDSESTGEEVEGRESRTGD
jgi:hypothetical protein